MERHSNAWEEKEIPHVPRVSTTSTIRLSLFPLKPQSYMDRKMIRMLHVLLGKKCLTFSAPLKLHGVGIRRLFSAISRHCGMVTMDAFASLTNSSLISFSILDCWRSLTVISIPKSSSPTALAKPFRPVFSPSSGLEMTGNALFNCLRFSVHLPDEPFPFAYKANRSTFTRFVSP